MVLRKQNVHAIPTLAGSGEVVDLAYGGSLEA
jgi:hypothetical protein